MDKKYWITITVTVLAVSNMVTGFLLFSGKSNADQKKFQERYPLLDPGRGIYAQDDLIVNVQPLRDKLNKIGQDADISIYFELLNTGANIAVNKDVKIWPASLMKIPIAMAVMKKVENGQWSVDEEFTLEEGDKNNIFGDLYKKPSGTRLKLKELLDELLINSDNTARNIFARALELDDFGAVIDHLGIEFDYVDDDQITAKRYSIIWRSLFTSSYLSPENSEKMIEIMSRSSATMFSAQSIPREIKFSHKIGVLYDKNIYADSGIVYIPSRPYILTVMIKNKSQHEAEKIMKDISENTYRYVSEY